MSNRAESLVGGGAGSGLGGSSSKLHKGESGGSGLKKPDGDDGVKVGSMGVVNADESDGLYDSEYSDRETVVELAVLERKERGEAACIWPMAKERE